MNIAKVASILCLIFSTSQLAQARDRQSLPVLGDVRDVDSSVNPWKMERTNPTENTSAAPVRIELVKVQPFNNDSIKLHIPIEDCNALDTYKYVSNGKLYFFQYQAGPHHRVTTDATCGTYEITMTLTEEELEMAVPSRQYPGLILPQGGHENLGDTDLDNSSLSERYLGSYTLEIERSGRGRISSATLYVNKYFGNNVFSVPIQTLP